MTTKARLAVLATTPFLGLAIFCAAALAETDDPMEKEMKAAQAALEEAIPRAAKDPYRPMYHYRPPARWMNEPCGAVYYKGYHHIFHQNNPYSDDVYGWGWGHTRSKDLVHWEVLPFALAPMKHRGAVEGER